MNLRLVQYWYRLVDKSGKNVDKKVLLLKVTKVGD